MSGQYWQTITLAGVSCSLVNLGWKVNPQTFGALILIRVHFELSVLPVHLDSADILGIRELKSKKCKSYSFLCYLDCQRINIYLKLHWLADRAVSSLWLFLICRQVSAADLVLVRIHSHWTVFVRQQFSPAVYGMATKALGLIHQLVCLFMGCVDNEKIGICFILQLHTRGRTVEVPQQTPPYVLI